MLPIRWFLILLATGPMAAGSRRGWWPALLLGVLLLGNAHGVRAQALAKLWDLTLGGPNIETAPAMVLTPDGGCLVGGTSLSDVGGDKTQPNWPGGIFPVPNYWVVRLDANGQKSWDRTFGVPSLDPVYGAQLTALALTPDGGFLLGGSTRSGAVGDKTQPSFGFEDYWIIKIDAQGSKVWDHTYGGSGQDFLTALVPTADGGYLLGGISGSPVSGTKSQPSLGDRDYWVVKIDAQGQSQWDRTYGGPGNDWLTCLLQAPDGGYLLGGTSDSEAGGDKTEPGYHAPPNALGDYWVVRLNARGAKLWDRTLGNSALDDLRALQATADGGFLLAGTTGGPTDGDRTLPGPGLSDYWLVKLDAQGQKRWDASYGGSRADELRTLHATPDGGYLLGGFSASGVSGSKTEPAVSPAAAPGDYWLVSINALGQLRWDKTLGGTDRDQLSALLLTPDGGLLTGGVSRSNVSGDKTEPPRSRDAADDFWLVKLGGRVVPAVAVHGDSLLCAGGQVQLTALPSPTRLLTGLRWSTGATTASITVAQPGTYSVTATFADGSTRTASYRVLALLAQARIDGDTVGCAAAPAQLRVVAAGATAYRWSTGATTPAITAAQPGTYSVEVAFGSGCRVTLRRTVRPAPPLLAFMLGPDTTLCAGSTLLLQAPLGPGLRYYWQDGSSAPTLRVASAGTYTLELRSPCDVRTVTRRVSYQSCLVLPNVITPNGDGHNDRFVVPGLPRGDWELRLYNRWGREVYQTRAYRHDWGAEAPPGVYYYRLRQGSTSYNGHVEVVR